MTAKPPVAIRITRPYATEDEFLAAELDTISRTGVVLVGAQQRPEGVVLRFELTLGNGAPLLRGEGRVIAFKPNVVGTEGGLALRFTRLDSKSKSLVDRVGAMREQRRSSMIPPPPVPPAAPPPPLPSSGEIPVVAEAPVSESQAKVEPPKPEPPTSEPKPESKPSLAQARDGTDRFARLRERAARISADEAARIFADGAARRRK